MYVVKYNRLLSRLQENEAMMRRLARNTKGRGHNSESSKVQSLARMAGIQIPADGKVPGVPRGAGSRRRST
jgi:hypothetical protein